MRVEYNTPILFCLWGAHMSTLSEQIAQLEAAIAAQEALRPMVGDMLVNIAVTTLRAQLDTLRAQVGIRVSGLSDHTSIQQGQPQAGQPQGLPLLDAHLAHLQHVELIRLFSQQPD